MAEESHNGAESGNVGTIVEIRGVVLDVRFPGSPFRFRCRVTDERHTSEFRTMIKWRSSPCRNAKLFVCSIRRVAQDRTLWSRCESRSVEGAKPGADDVIICPC